MRSDPITEREPQETSISNPESFEHIRCRICFEQTRPLVTLCDCSGSIAYMHEECIMNWITLKMETAEELAIPHCEVCRAEYRAGIQFCEKRFSFKILMVRMMELGRKEITASCLYVAGLVVVVYLLSMFVLSLFDYVFTGGALSTFLGNRSEFGVAEVFSHVVFPLYFARAGVKNLMEKKDLWKDSMLQIVELTIFPKSVVKEQVISK